MENEQKKKAKPEIDEEYLMNIIADGVKKEGLNVPPEPPKKPEPEKVREPEKPVGREKSRSKKASEADYEQLFFKRAETNARNGKSVYIRPDFHERLSRIVQVIGEDKITIYAYLDNLLEYHFQEFGEDITKSFNAKYKPIL
ncbi:conjugal transfer protein TraB [Elizabethkingia anophelis]|uniref:Conjugative transposon protein TraB n=1 Tax=Elizabethkingia anophelis TaxID=1117645 RepID=A0A455ZCU7_9FLAO|nr:MULTISPECIES: DUF3408 domain-containing protein [Bacteroidota]ASV79764.1 DUF3408 domain-containing protein [Elizabethkingia anophelis]MBB1647402.1 conjugal transfer protein TraB [Sphingobacterium sp. UME9]MDV3551377.1 conjugal transfer protein TraB [Elizabethkingia anophelis]MDV3569795.1 conjugal transfer protein TraB [Elizabethkingia anophelis]MDV3619296.1 conjugal transfer protein TraB [Elizabethkingia anophelis]